MPCIVYKMNVGDALFKYELRCLGWEQLISLINLQI